MEPNKLENQFREKLVDRKIEPSDTSWDRLDAMLSVTDSSNSKQAKQKAKKSLSWLYMAASITGFLVIGTIFFYHKEDAIELKSDPLVIENNAPKEEVKNETNSISNDADDSKVVLEKESKLLLQKNKIAKAESKNQIINVQPPLNSELKPQKQVETSVVVEKTVPDNVDDLLASVEMKSEKRKSSVKINSTNLLNQVDGELEITFREKALNTITQKYKEAKEALANRNNQ